LSTGTKISSLRKKLAPRKLSFINKLFLFFTISVCLLQVLCYVTPYVSPADFWPIAFLGLAYPYIFIVCVLNAIYWAIQWSKYFIIPFSVLLGGIYQIGAFFQLNITEPLKDNKSVARDSSLIKVMTYNVRVFDLYNWSHNKETRNEIFSLLEEENPDVLCLQEFYNDKEKKFKTHDTLITFLDANKSHIEYTKTLYGTHQWGIATYSKYPIVNKGVIKFGEKANNICIYTDLIISGDTVRVYNTHMQSVHFGYKDYKFIEDVRNNRETDELEGGKRILSRLKIAYEKRGEQAEWINKSITSCRYPLIVCGDFNDTPLSYSVKTVSSNLKDAYRESGNGFGRTYLGRFAPYRIDYIFHSPQLNTENYQVLPDELSDHYPVTALIRLNNGVKQE
jgi:endonuclease/exonuclease/phosphatase family metal-dependent hydrolase